MTLRAATAMLLFCLLRVSAANMTHMNFTGDAGVSHGEQQHGPHDVDEEAIMKEIKSLSFVGLGDEADSMDLRDGCRRASRTHEVVDWFVPM